LLVFKNSIVKIDRVTIRPKNKAKSLHVPTRLPEETPSKNVGDILSNPINILNNSKIKTIIELINKEPKNIHIFFSFWKWIDDKKKIQDIIRIDPNVPTSKPLPNKDRYNDGEKNEDIRKTNGIIPANRIILSFGTVNFPSPRRDINQKNTDKVIPINIRKPLLADRLMGTNGIKKKIETNKVEINVINDKLLKNSIFFDSII